MPRAWSPQFTLGMTREAVLPSTVARHSPFLSDPGGPRMGLREEMEKEMGEAAQRIPLYREGTLPDLTGEQVFV
jgi:hypothetical protein